MKPPYKSGQTLIIVLLVMAVALTLGVAISTRALLTLRQISFSGQSAQALSFAEAGAEDGLRCLSDGSCTVPYDPPARDINNDGENDFDYNIEQLGGSSVFDELPALQRDKTVQISLSGYPGGTSVEFYWADRANSDEINDPAAIEITFVYNDSGTYKVIKYAYDPVPGFNRRFSNNFSAPPSLGYSINGKSYQYRVTPATPGGVKLMRIRALYNNIPNSFAVAGSGGALLPSQGVKITSKGFSGQAVRTVEVIRTNPALSEIFDYVLFSGSQTTPLSK